ncbi:HalOD1 output domain-containing protein [Halomarina pelagica]|uniref:HalOD1 output domain-containing protein n=1 Tax=Halomarina pelagica TaxID=2961599 RepID=UPI0020C26890|nr:HalOD1 output domain-containing protein [Halomarina sp. BND7]
MRLTRRAVDAPLVAVVAELVGEFEGVDPVRLDPPLHDVVDPDALDELVGADPSGTTRVELTYRDLTVSVGADRTVTVSDAASSTPPDDAPAPSA